MALVGMSAAGKGMAAEERKRAVDEIVSDSMSVMQSYGDASGLVFELITNLATARG
jgi:hypothetical protein